MSGLTVPCPFPLSRGRLRRVRSAAVHALSLADVALIRTLSWAPTSLALKLVRVAQAGRFPPRLFLMRLPSLSLEEKGRPSELLR